MGNIEKILLVQGSETLRLRLAQLLEHAGFAVFALADGGNASAVAREQGIDVAILDAQCPRLDCEGLLADLHGSGATETVRVILMVSGGAAERSHGLELGADDVISDPWDPAELLARVRGQLRSKRREDALRQKMEIAEESRQTARRAFQSLATTGRSLLALDRRLKYGLLAVTVLGLVMLGAFAWQSRQAARESRRIQAVVARLERGWDGQRDLIHRAAQLRQEREAADAQDSAAGLRRELEELRARLAAANSEDVSDLRRQLTETRTRLGRLEREGRVAQEIIRSYLPSVGLLHVTVAFRERDSRRLLRYAGVTPEGTPLLDGEGNPVFSLTGSGPEVRVDVFGTGFLVAEGRILTNRHVVEPWWHDEELRALEKNGFVAVLNALNAYFPDVQQALPARVLKISPDADLAVVSADLSRLKRPIVELDFRESATASGRPVVLLGYPTGLAALLARAGDDVIRELAAETHGQPDRVMAALARRRLIRPLATQGHIGDVLADRIVYDAQTSSGGSGGPLFSSEGRVIGVNFGMMSGFGGSNMAIPIRKARALLAP